MERDTLLACLAALMAVIAIIAQLCTLWNRKKADEAWEKVEIALEAVSKVNQK